MFNSRTRLIIVNSPNNPIGKVDLVVTPRSIDICSSKGFLLRRIGTHRPTLSETSSDLHLGRSLRMDYLRSKETHSNGDITEHVGTNVDHRQCRKDLLVDGLEARMDDWT